MTLRRQSKLPPLSADALLICPRGGNTGDLLIADACEKFLHDRGISAWRSDGSIEDAAVADDSEYLGDLFASFRGMLMFVGGGNIGIYPDNELIRAQSHCTAEPAPSLSCFSSIGAAPGARVSEAGGNRMVSGGRIRGAP